MKIPRDSLRFAWKGSRRRTAGPWRPCPGQLVVLWPFEQVGPGAPPVQRQPAPTDMLRPVTRQMAAVAERHEVRPGAVAGIMIKVRRRQDHPRAPDPRRDLGGHEVASEGAPGPVAPDAGVLIPLGPPYVHPVGHSPRSGHQRDETE